jgi:ribonuclease BN (tRNA processing enzyme)
MSRFQVLVVGVGDAFTARHHSTSVVLRADGFSLGIDCPDRYREALQTAGAKAGQAGLIEAVDHLLITHLHGDHVNGLEGFAFYKHFVEHKRLGLVISPEVRQVIWEQRLMAPMGTLWDGQNFRQLGFDDYFQLLPLPFDQTTSVGPFRIRTRRTVHHIPTSALLVEAQGRTFGFSADTAFDPGLINFLKAADLIFHETNHGPAHTPYERLAALPADLRQKMRLVHYADDFDVGKSTIRVATEGELLEV